MRSLLRINGLTAGMLCVALALQALIFAGLEQRRETETLRAGADALAGTLAVVGNGVGSGENASILESVRKLLNSAVHRGELTYAVVTNAQGELLFPVISSEPNLAVHPASDHLAGYTEVTGTLGIDQHSFRLGYLKPTFMAALMNPLPLLFLLLPGLVLLPLLLKLETSWKQPVTEMSAQLSTLLRDTEQPPAEGDAPLDITALQRYLEDARVRVQEAEEQSDSLITREKFLSYRVDRYESILQTIPDALLILDQDHKVMFMNQQVASLFNVTPSDVLSEPVETWCQDQTFVDYVRKLRRDPQSVMAGEETMPDPKNPGRTFGLTAHPLNFQRAGAGTLGTVILLHDISREVAARQSRAEFVGSISHEVKTPLNTIGLYAQMISEHFDDKSFLVEAQNTIEHEIERMTRLIHNLLAMTQIEMGTFELDPQRTQLPEVVQDCLSMLDHGQDANRIRVSAAANLPAISVDKELFRIAISNLISNGLKYSPVDKEVSVEINETDDAIQVVVTDQGQGIDPQDLDRIFDKFYRSKRNPESVKGHGLGLAIVRDIINLHHGSLDVQSEPGEGSKFTISLWKSSGIAKHAI